MLGYIFLGYPLIISLFSKLIPNAIKKKNNQLTVTLVIPAHNEEDVIAEKIENVLNFNFPQNRLQIIIVDDGSSDNTASIVKDYLGHGIQFLSNNPRQGKVAALNLSMQHALGDIFIISDADITTDPDAINNILPNFSDPVVGCVVGKGVFLKNDTETTSSNSLYSRYDSKIKIAESNIHSTVGVSGHTMAIRRNILEQIPTNIILDDFYLAMTVIKKGYRVIFDPNSISYERSTLSIQDEILRRKRITAGRYHIISIAKKYLPHLPSLIIFQIISHKFLRLLIPEFMIIAFICNIFLVFDTRFNSDLWITNTYVSLFFFQSLFYFLAILGGLTKRMNKSIKFLYLPYYLVVTNLASLSGLYWFLTNQKSVMWDQAKRTNESSRDKFNA